MTKAAAVFCLSMMFSGLAVADQSHVDRYLSLTEPEEAPDLSQVQAFGDLFGALDSGALAEQVSQTYAEQLYFNDTFVTLSSREDLLRYLESVSEEAESVHTRILDVVRSGDNWYVRWLLEMRFRVLGKSRFSRSVGMTHLQFDSDQRIILHQDFWDSAGGFYQHIPVVAGLISWIQKKVHR